MRLLKLYAVVGRIFACFVVGNCAFRTKSYKCSFLFKNYDYWDWA